MLIEYAYTFSPQEWTDPRYDGIPAVPMFGDLIADHLPDEVADPLLYAVFLTPVHPELRSGLIGNLAYVASYLPDRRLQMLRAIEAISRWTPVFANNFDADRFREIFERAASS